jgi:hypothetical protein
LIRGRSVNETPEQKRSRRFRAEVPAAIGIVPKMVFLAWRRSSSHQIPPPQAAEDRGLRVGMTVFQLSFRA